MVLFGTSIIGGVDVTQWYKCMGVDLTVNYLIFQFLYSVNKAKLGVDFCYSTLSVLTVRQKMFYYLYGT